MTVEVIFDVCSESTTGADTLPQSGVLSAHCGYGSQNGGEKYQVHQCEQFSFITLGGLRREHMVNYIFDHATKVTKLPN